MELIQLKILNYLKEIQSKSPANKRKVGAVIVDSEGNIISEGYNYNLDYLTKNCENSDGITLDTVIHAEQRAIFNLLNSKNNDENLSMYITYSPCIECVKQIILSKRIKNIYILEEHSINFRNSQNVHDSKSALEMCNEFNINVYKLVDDEFIDLNQKKACIYHSVDLDGFMSRFLMEQIVLKGLNYDFYGYNYESEADWMYDDSITELIFVDCTPPLKWLLNLTGKKITIIDHHQKTLESIIDSFCEKDLLLNDDSSLIIRDLINYDSNYTTEIKLITSENQNYSGCKLISLYYYTKYYSQFEYYQEVIDNISNYDTWSFVNFNTREKDNLLYFIEALKCLNYEQFVKEVLNYKANKVILKTTGLFLSYKANKNISKILLTSKIIEYQDIIVIIGNLYPDYYLQTYLMQNFDKSIIYMSYFIDLNNNIVEFSVRYYDNGKNNNKYSAVDIAKFYGGGGHQNAAGFKLPLNNGLSLIENFDNQINTNFPNIFK